MNATFTKSNLCGTVSAPPSKSFAHRMIISAALCDGKSIINGISLSEDILATLDCIKALGAEYTLCGTELTINGGIKAAGENLFFCRDSASTLRFFIPLSLIHGGEIHFIGSSRLLERGIDVYEKAFENITFEKSQNKIIIKGTLSHGNFVIPGNISSQYISGLLFALPLLENSSTLKIIPPIESKSYIEITLNVLTQFGIIIKRIAENKFFIEGNQKYKSLNTSVEGDWSNAAFYYALNSLGNDITIKNISDSSIQGDKICTELFKKLDEKNPVINISDIPDLAPILFAVSAAKHGAVFTGTHRLKIKECDRASAMAQELSKFGINVEVEENSVTVHNENIHAPLGELESHNDHRIVMALSVLLTITGGTINNIEAINKSYPNFFDDLKNLGAKINFE